MLTDIRIYFLNHTFLLPHQSNFGATLSKFDHTGLCLKENWLKQPAGKKNIDHGISFSPLFASVKPANVYIKIY